MTAPPTLEISEWVKLGAMMVRRDALDHEHPESFPSRIAAMGQDPTQYGFPAPKQAKYCAECGARQP